MIIWLPILWMATGICLFAGVHFMHADHGQENARLFPAFGVLSLAVGAYIAVSALMQTPAQIAPWAALERLHVAIACFIFPAAVWFLSLYSRLRAWRGWVLGSVVIFGVLLVINLTGTHGLLLSDVVLAPPLELPWGEQINQFTGTSTALAPVYYLATLLIFVWAFWRCWALWKRGEVARARPVAIYLVLKVIATGYADYTMLHPQAGLDWDAVPFVALVLLLGQALTAELRRYAHALNASNDALREENARRTEAQTKLRHTANHDAISELPNRHALRDWLDAALTADPPQQGALLVIDPERFDIINHALGHRAGDLLIREIGKRLSGSVDAHGFVARLSGDEFAAVVTVAGDDADAASRRVMKKVETLRGELAEPLHVGRHALLMSAHMGLAMFRDAGGESEALLRHAYVALRAAKRLGHNELASFAHSMQVEGERRLQLEVDLRAAIENDELQVLYQPQTGRSGQLVGAEALLRWDHPVYGSIAPQEFVGIAEDTGQIQTLGRWVLRAALGTLAGLPANDSFRMSVNVSPWQLFLAEFLQTVKTAIDEAAVEPRRVTLEITETAFIHDITDANAKIRALDAMGVRVSIDDFGTGYASIASLKALPVKELKIDQVFIADMSTVQPDRFVAAMVALRRALNLHVIAEGVEHETQRETLMRMGCDAFQGFLISHPLTAAELADWNAKAIPRDVILSS